jgi:Predicted inhibitor of MCP methylation, homolog of CheC
MDDRYIEPFCNSVLNVLPQFGIADVAKVRVYERGRSFDTHGIIVVLGLIGDIRGNVIYSMTEQAASGIAALMMGMELPSFDEMAQSAVSELTNMLTANASIELAGSGITIDISTPTLMTGKFSATANCAKIVTIEMTVSGQPFEINLAIDKIA